MFHLFHLVEPRLWPLVGSLGAGMLTLRLVNLLYSGESLMVFFSLFTLIIVSYQWWRDVSREATIQGHHRRVVEKGIRWGIILFIVSEIMFFLSFFWAYFHSRLAPTVELGLLWPPYPIEAFNPLSVPLLNTTILLTSGLSITWRHHAIVEGDYSAGIIGLRFTILLGIYFTVVQAYEYLEASFTIADSTYGSCFFVATGFHGLHVLIGTLFLIVTLIRILSSHFSSAHHFGFEAAAWYWHFVDVVWIFLFIRIYWWGS